MDSGSGSMQSSSGGDDEYDSRAESISALLSNPPSQLGHHMTNPPPHHHHQQQTHQQLDPLSNMFDPLSSRLTNQNPLLNFDMVWSKTLRSDHNPTDLGGLSQPFLTNPMNQLGQSRGGAGAGGGGSSTFAALQIPHDHPQNVSASSSAPTTNNSNKNNTTSTNNNNGVVRNPKKRSRASRRAPTTVLTTDTSNFRAMVQEFTGIPAPPFTSSSPFPRSRLDLFGTSAASSLMRSSGAGRGGGGGGGGGGLGLDSSTPSYLLRPFAQKLTHQQPPPPSSSMLDPTTMQNPSSSSSSVLNFQSLFQPQQNHPKYPQLPINNSPNNVNLGSSNVSNSKPPHHHQHVLEDHHFGLAAHQPHVNVNNPQQLNVLPANNLVSSSDGALSRHDNSNLNWGDGTGPNNNNNNSIDNNNNVDHHHHHQGLMRSMNGSYNNGKLNYSAGSSSNNVVHGDKTRQDQNVAATTARSEGMVESWICSSD